MSLKLPPIKKPFADVAAAYAEGASVAASPLEAIREYVAPIAAPNIDLRAYPEWPPIQVLIADCPWAFTDVKGATGAGAAEHYTTLTIEQIKAFPLPPLAPNAVLFLWRVEALGALCYDVAKAWGFTPKSKLTWIKTKACDRCDGHGYTCEGPTLKWCNKCKGHGSRVQMGMGHYTRRSTEDCIIAVRDSAKPTDCHPDDHATVDFFHAPRGIHSAKPDKFYQIVEKLYPGRAYGELFARRRRANWYQEGLELPAIDGEESLDGDAETA